MASDARGLGALRIYLEMIKFEHSIFALPFAMIGMIWASFRVTDGEHIWPALPTVLWIVVAMVSCRSAAMAFNRIADRQIDALNPRTRMRAIPAGLLALRQANLFFAGSCVVFFIAAGMLNPLALMLSPLALGITLFYSATKRFTWLCHLVLGLSLAIAPAAAWIGVTGSLDAAILPTVGAVIGWVAGFDILYSLQDVDFDRSQGLHSIPEQLEIPRAILISRILHGCAIACLMLAGWSVGAGTAYYLGVAVCAGLLIYEQSLVKPDDLSRIDLAFFTLNGFVSIALFGFTWADLLLRRS